MIVFRMKEKRRRKMLNTTKFFKLSKKGGGFLDDKKGVIFVVFGFEMGCAKKKVGVRVVVVITK